MTTIIGIKLVNREHDAAKLQEILTKFGCYIKTRIGLHQVENSTCHPSGIILIEVIDNEKAKELEVKLCDIDSIEIQRMVF